jgi:hypothetical protein
MEIDSVSPSDLDWQLQDPPWLSIGEKVAIASLFIAAAAAIPAMTRKKRVFIPLRAEAPAQIQFEPEEIPDCSPQDRAKIFEIFQTLAEKTFFNPFRLKQLGEEIDPVHPFAFLLHAPKRHVQAIFRGAHIFKINGVLGGIEKGILREKADLDRYIPRFAEQMGKEAEPIRRLISESNWRELVHYLFDVD